MAFHDLDVNAMLKRKSTAERFIVRGKVEKGVCHLRILSNPEGRLIEEKVCGDFHFNEAHTQQ